MTLKDPEAPPAPVGFDRPLPPPPPGTIRNALPVGRTKFGTTSGVQKAAQIYVIYGPGGWGKTSMCCAHPSHKIIDVEGGSNAINANRIVPGDAGWDFPTVREAMRTPELYKGSTFLIVDSLTKLEDRAASHIMATVPHEKGKPITSLDSYGFGKGQRHVYDAMLAFMEDCEFVVSQGTNVVLIAHEVVTNTMDTLCGDHKRFDMRLQMGEKTNVSKMVRDAVRELWFVTMEFDHEKDNEGRGIPGTNRRVIYPVSEVGCHAKSSIFTEKIRITSPEDYKRIWAIALKGK